MSNSVMLWRLDDTLCLDNLHKTARVTRVYAAGSAPNLSKMMTTAPVRDTVPDVSSGAAEPVTV
jgi:hypothetical protein